MNTKITIDDITIRAKLKPGDLGYVIIKRNPGTLFRGFSQLEKTLSKTLTWHLINKTLLLAGMLFELCEKYYVC